MPEQEIVTATELAAEQPVEVATPPVAEPKAEAQPEPKQDPDWQAAYVGLQRTVNKAHARTEDVLRQNAALAEALKEVKETTGLLARQTLGEDEVKALESRQAQAQERAAALAAAQSAGQFISAQTGLFLDVLKAAGIEPTDPEIDWGRNARDVQEWRDRVGPSITARLEKANADRIRRYEEGVKAKNQKEVQAEAEALAQQQLKEAGVDRIDTAKGSGPTRLADRIKDMDTNSEEFKKFYSDATSGRLTKLR